MKLKRGDTVWFWYRGTRVRAVVHKVKGADCVVYLAGQRVQLPKLRARPIGTFPASTEGEG